MTKKGLSAIVIGAGIHGVTSSLALATKGIDVMVIEKRPGLLQGTSGSTHNRAHLGYHYPRSIETASECIKGLEFFRKKYPKALSYPSEAYYFIDKKESKTSSEEFKAFCDEMKIPYKINKPKDCFINPDSIEQSFIVPEPVFSLNDLRELLKRECSEKKVVIKNDSELIGYRRMPHMKHRIKVNEKGNIKEYEADLIINCTYAYSNNILRILELEKDMTNYIIQTTEVGVTKSEKTIPAMTVMDGEFISLMPCAGSMEKNTLLIYDVRYSVAGKQEGYFFDDSIKYSSNFKKMIEHGKTYFPFMEQLQYINSLWGSRPIPIDSKADSRKTRIITHENSKGIYSLLEGKFISAPLIAEELANKIKEEIF